VGEGRLVTVASIQLWHSDDDSKEDRIARAEQLIDGVAGSDLILLPELWSIGWWSFDAYRENSEDLHGQTVSRIGEKARAINAYILAGSIVERENDSLYNTAVLLDPKGQIVARYRKIHLSSTGDGARESQLMKRGEEIVVAKTDLGVIGLSICYDLDFPELYRKMAVNHGVEIFLLPSAWRISKLDNWRELCHARACENQCFLISCDSAGINRGNQYLGHSAIVGPWGVSIASAGIYESVVKGEIDISQIYEVRESLPLFKDRFFSV
jgi:predicted amidohydrolase